jgi:hypothetical protein
MQESGLVNLFKDRENSWACVEIDEIIAASPDVVIIVETTWDGDSAQDKINFLHNRSALLCNAPFVKNADYIKIPFSASTPGPRNGVAALDMVNAAIHVTTGADTLNFKSGVGFFNTTVLVDHTADFLCPFVPKVRGESASVSVEDKLPTWAIALIAIACVLCLLFFACALAMCIREKQGKPMFTSLEPGTAKDNSKA